MLFATLDPTLRDAEAARRPAGDPVRHRGLHLRPAARTGRGLPRHPGGGAGGRRRSCTCATSPAADSEAQAADVETVLSRARRRRRTPAAPSSRSGTRSTCCPPRTAAVLGRARAARRGPAAAGRRRLGGDRRGLRRPAGVPGRPGRRGAADRGAACAAGEGEALAWLYRHGRVVDRSDEDDGAVRLCVRLDSQALGRFERLFPDARLKEAAQ